MKKSDKCLDLLEFKKIHECYYEPETLAKKLIY